MKIVFCLLLILMTASSYFPASGGNKTVPSQIENKPFWKHFKSLEGNISAQFPVELEKDELKPEIQKLAPPRVGAVYTVRFANIILSASFEDVYLANDKRENINKFYEKRVNEDLQTAQAKLLSRNEISFYYSVNPALEWVTVNETGTLQTVTKSLFHKGYYYEFKATTALKEVQSEIVKQFFSSVSVLSNTRRAGRNVPFDSWTTHQSAVFGFKAAFPAFPNKYENLEPLGTKQVLYQIEDSLLSYTIGGKWLDAPNDPKLLDVIYDTWQKSGLVDKNYQRIRSKPIKIQNYYAREAEFLSPDKKYAMKVRLLAADKRFFQIVCAVPVRPDESSSNKILKQNAVQHFFNSFEVVEPASVY